MSPAHWQKVKTLFEAAHALPRAERAAYLAEVCAGEPELRAEVESLLSADDEADNFLEESSLEIGAQAEVVLQALPDRTLGQRWGSYAIEREIGEGGMGTVYEAVRADDLYRKRVAIKIVKAGLDDEAMLRRFRQERQILATLEHPGIARLIDAGRTPDGRPYLVMEYVSGQPITIYCDEKRLSTTERLKLFRQVCAAVDAAHVQGVVHRDIKPNNILISADGSPKLLDFGIAKILNPELQTGPLDPTVTLLRMMTPEYASPEQVRGEPVSQASDVYTLGVLLYELLTGHRPYRRKTRAPHELAKAICDDDPPKPSNVITQPVETPTESGVRIVSAEEISQLRGGAPAELRRKLAGDLDCIVLKAMRKEPEKRYQSARELSDDLERHLEARPVNARRDTPLYRGRKYLQRHRWLVISAAVYLLLIVSGLALWRTRGTSGPAAPAVPAVVTTRTSIAVLGFQNLTHQPDAAWLSTAMSEMLTTELSANDGLRAIPQENVARVKTDLQVSDGETLARDSLQKIYRNLSADFVVLGSYIVTGSAPQRTFRWDLRVQNTKNGEIEVLLSDEGNERELPQVIGRVGATLRQKFGVLHTSERPSDNSDITSWSNAEALRVYAEGLAEARKLNDQRARELLQKAVQIDPSFPWPHMTLAVTWQDLGYARLAEEEARKAFELSGKLQRQERLFIEGRYHEIRHDWAQASERFRTLRLFYPDDLNYGLRLATVQTLSGRGKEALTTIEELRRLPKPQSDDPRLDLAEAQAAGALSDYRRQLTASQRAEQKGQALGGRNLVARALDLQAAALDELGDWESARTAYQRAYDLAAQVDNRAIQAASLHGLALVRHEQGHPREAIELAGKELAISREIANKKLIAQALTGLGRLHQAQGEPAKAKEVLEQADTLWRELDDKRNLAIGLSMLGQLLQVQGQVAESQKLYEESLQVYRDVGDKGSVAKALYSTARGALRQGSLSRALQLAQESIALRREVGDSANIPVVEQFTGGVLWQKGELDAARTLLQRVVALKRQQGDRRILAYTLYNLGNVQLQEGNVSGAKQSWEEAAGICRELNEKGVVAGIQLGLAEVALEEGNAAAAEKFAVEAGAEFHREKRPDDESLAQTVRARTLLARGQVQAAQAASREASALAQPSQILEIRLVERLTAAAVSVAAGEFGKAEARLQEVIAEAQKAGYVFHEAQARLLLAEAEVRSGRRTDGAARLQKLEQEADAKGFVMAGRRVRAVRKRLSV